MAADTTFAQFFHRQLLKYIRIQAYVLAPALGGGISGR
jgi:hypothetical protein